MKNERSSVALLSARGDHLRRELRRALVVLMAASLIAGSCPPKARAVAILDDAVVLAGVAVLLTSIGVSYWARSDSMAKQVLADKLQQYFDTLSNPPASYSEWLDGAGNDDVISTTGQGIFSFPSAIANKFLSFARWLQGEDDLQSGGAPATTLGQPLGLGVSVAEGLDERIAAECSMEQSASNSFVYHLSAYNGAPSNNLEAIWIISFPVEQVDNVIIRSTSYTGRFDSSLNGGASYRAGIEQNLDIPLSYVDNRTALLYIRHVVTRGTSYTASISIEMVQPLYQPVIVSSITPSSTVVVPDDLEPATTLQISTNAPTVAGDTPRAAAETIFDTITASEGLSSDISEVSSSVPSNMAWLWETIISLPQSIAEALTPQYTDIDDYTLSLTSVFPFCIPWDIARCLSYFAADPVIPCVTWNMPLPDLIGGGTYALTIDLTPFDTPAEVLRHLELIAFAVGLLVETKRIIKW